MLQMKHNALELLLVLRILTFPLLWLNLTKPPSATFSFVFDFSKWKFGKNHLELSKVLLTFSESIKAKEKQ